MEELVFRKIDSQDEIDIKKYMQIRKKSLEEDYGEYNLLIYPEEEKNFNINGYKQRNALQNYFVLEYKERFVGYIAFAQHWPKIFQGEHNFNIGPVYIDSNFRGKGYGKHIVEKNIEYIKKDYDFEVKNLFLIVNKNSFVAQNLYKDLGFYEVGVQKNYIKTKEGRYFDVVLMSKVV